MHSFHLYRKRGPPPQCEGMSTAVRINNITMEELMKKLLLAFAIIAATALVPLSESRAGSFSYTHMATIAHYAHNQSWWTGLGILNTSGENLTVYIFARDGSIGKEAYGYVELSAEGKVTGMLPALCPSGIFPGSGSIYLYADGAFLVSKFMANTSTSPGFGEIQLDPIIVPGTVTW